MAKIVIAGLFPRTSVA